MDNFMVHEAIESTPQTNAIEISILIQLYIMTLY